MIFFALVPVYIDRMPDEPERISITTYTLAVHDPPQFTELRPDIGRFSFDGGLTQWSRTQIPYPVPNVGDEIDFETFPGDPDHRAHLPAGKTRVVRRVAHRFGRGEYHLDIYVDIVDRIDELPLPSWFRASRWWNRQVLPRLRQIRR